MVSVYTKGEICKKCYSCVRSCPTKAIEVHEGQADIIEELCISCGYCVTTCSQGAKAIRSSIDSVLNLIKNKGEQKVYAMLAPSFPASFLNVKPEKLVGALRELGFDGVYEVAFGADLVSYRYYQIYKNLKNEAENKFLISSPCPAVVSYIEKIVPELLPYLANIASPMEAIARVIKQKIDPKGKTVFIGPCVAKKDEADKSDFVDEVLTYEELAQIFERESIDYNRVKEVDFNLPHANLGRIYPVTGGLLKAACIEADLLDSPVYVVEGKERIVDILTVLSEYVRNGKRVNYKFFDLLFCEGCIGGPVMENDLTFYERKKYIVEYINSRPVIKDIDKWVSFNREYIEIDLTKNFHPEKAVEPMPTEEEIRKILAMTNKFRPEDELNCRACGYSSCREKAIAVYRGKAEVEMCLPYLITKLEKTIEDLKENQAKLIQAEKLASMGQMAAGIAHEINNPLGVVLMYSYLLKDEIGDKTPVVKDVERIIKEAERTRKIVKGILNFARKEKIERKEVDINALLKRSVEDIVGNELNKKYKVNYNLDPQVGKQWVDESQLKQVFDNIIKNATEAMPEGGTITITTKNEENEFSITIADTGPGIPEEHLSKLFSPFFTTKPVGKGTGLGLPVCYGIVKMHEGSITAGNNPDGGAYFTIKIKHYTKEGKIA